MWKTREHTGIPWLVSDPRGAGRHWQERVLKQNSAEWSSETARHPCERPVGQAVLIAGRGVAAADVGVPPRKDHLGDVRAHGPNRWPQTTTLLGHPYTMKAIQDTP